MNNITLTVIFWFSSFSLIQTLIQSIPMTKVNEKNEWNNWHVEKSRRKKNSIMHSIYFFSVVVVGFDISMWKFASATLFSMLFQWLNELLSFTRFLISKLWWKWLSICGLNSKKTQKQQLHLDCAFHLLILWIQTNPLFFWFAFIKSHHWKWIIL